MIFRLLALTFALLIGIGVLIPLATRSSEAVAPSVKINKKKYKNYKKYSKKWWRAYHHRIRKKKSLEARKQTLRLRRIRLAKTGKALSQPTNQKPAKTASPPILVSNLFILVEGKIKDVFDGNTLNVQARDGKFYLVRLLGVDAPEMTHAFGNRSLENLSKLILGKDATIVIRKRDSAGRYLGTVYSGGEDINLRQIETGMAWYSRQNGYEATGGDRKLYEQAEQKARTFRKGVWGNQKSNNAVALNR